MMSDHSKKVKSGDPLRMPAATFNTFLDAARDWLARQLNIGGAPRRPRSASADIGPMAGGYAALIRRRCRCLDCGQVRIDKEYH
jgi:hypothetical protein